MASLFLECKNCNHPIYEHTHKSVKSLNGNCFHKDGWNTICKCRKFVKN